MPDHSFSKEIFPNIQSKPPLMQLQAISSRPIASYLGEETNTCLTTPSFQAVVETNKVSPQPPLLQTKQPRLPQRLLVRLVLAQDRVYIRLRDTVMIKMSPEIYGRWENRRKKDPALPSLQQHAGSWNCLCLALSSCCLLKFNWMKASRGKTNPRLFSPFP